MNSKVEGENLHLTFSYAEDWCWIYRAKIILKILDTYMHWGNNQKTEQIFSFRTVLRFILFQYTK